MTSDTLIRCPTQQCLPSDADTQAAIDAFRCASCRLDVQNIQRRFDHAILNAAWNQLDPLTRNTLKFLRAFKDSEILFDYDDIFQ